MTATLLTILLVEDNADHVALVKRILGHRRSDLRIMHVWDGEEALRYLHRESSYSDPQDAPRPDLVLLDLRLPKIDGLEVLEEIKSDSALEAIPVVVLSTSDAESDMSQAYSRYVASYLVKPFDLLRFERLIEELGLPWPSMANR